MSEASSTHQNDSAAEASVPSPGGVWGQAAKVIPYFKNPKHVLLFKLDIMLLLWMFVAGVSALPFVRSADIDSISLSKNLTKRQQRKLTSLACVKT